MRSIPKRIFVNDKRANERGASLVMTIMVAALLLAAYAGRRARLAYA